MSPHSSSQRDSSLTPREKSVLMIASAVVTLVPWSWGGSVPWTVFAGCGFSAAALIAAVGTLAAQRIALIGWAVGLGAAFMLVPPSAASWSPAWLNWTAFPISGFSGSAVVAWIMRADLKSRTSAESRADLLRFPPFWIGLILGAYVFIQMANPWGSVEDIEGFWKAQGLTLPKGEATHVLRATPHHKWLPSGLVAPFVGENRLWLGMNAWRVLAIWAGPWMFLCALSVALRRRRIFVLLGWVSLLSSLVVGAFGLVNQISWGTILGVEVPHNVTVFGTFFQRNHAGVHLYLHAALATALFFWHLRRSGEGAALGGPHLIAAFAALALSAVAVLVNSLGVLIVLGLMVFLLFPLAWKRGLHSAGFDVKEGAFYAGLAALVAALAILSVADLSQIETKLARKAAAFSEAGTDDRAPYRRATWAMATEGGATGRIWFGWGAGSYRWVSLAYQARQPELLRPNGSMRLRAHYAHNDWLQLLAELGVVGCLPVLAGLLWLLRRIWQSFVPGRPEALVLGGALALFMLHAWFDLLIWFTPMLYAVAVLVAAMLAFLSRSSTQEALS